MKNEVPTGLLGYYFQRSARDFREVLNYRSWKKRKALEKIPDNHLYKRQRIYDLQKKHQFDLFVETGTFYGQMVNAMKARFNKVVSIEIYEPLFKINDLAFKHTDHVTIMLGDSAKVLKTIMSWKNQSILFWLDGHYSGRGTGKGNQTSPIIEELDIILSNMPKKLCLVIDDLRLFVNEDGYPSKEEVVAILKAANPDFEIQEDNDALVAVLG